MSKPNTSRRLCVFAVVGAALAYAPFATAQATPDAKAKQSMDKVDTNKDGQVSKDEFMAAMEKKFDAMDKNKNKMLSQDEWLQQQLQETDGAQYPR